MKTKSFKILKKKKDIWFYFQKDKERWFLFSLMGLLLTMTLIIPGKGMGVSAPNPWKLIVNHTTEKCADLYTGSADNDPDRCSIPGGWEEAEYEMANFVCPKGYEHIGRFEGEQCLKLSQEDRHNPQHRSNRSGFGFGCASPSY